MSNGGRWGGKVVVCIGEEGKIGGPEDLGKGQKVRKREKSAITGREGSENAQGERGAVVGETEGARGSETG